MIAALALVVLAQNPPDLLAMHCGPALDYVVSTSEGPVDQSYVKKSGDYMFGTLRMNGTGTLGSILWNGSVPCGQNGSVCIYYNATGFNLYTAGAVRMNVSNSTGITSHTGDVNIAGNVQATLALVTTRSGAASIINAGTGWYEDDGATSAQIGGFTPTAGRGALKYDDTMACFRAYQNGAWSTGCIASTAAGGDGGASPSNATIFRLASVTTPAGVVDSTMNTILVGQQTSVTVRHLTGAFASLGTGGTGERNIQFDCVGIISGKRCLADINCLGTRNGFDGGTFFTVPFFGYGNSANCSFNNDIVRCLGRNAPVDGGTDCTADPVMLVNSLAIEGTYP